MNRTRALIIIGVFMLVLAVLAAMELRREDPVVAQGQMVTGTINTTHVPQEVHAPADADTGASSHSASMPLDNRAFRSGQAPVSSAPSPAAGHSPGGLAVSPPLPDKTELPQPTPSPVLAVSKKESTPPAKSVPPAPSREQSAAQQASTPAKKESAEPKEGGKETPSPLVITTQAPAKLTGKQKAITRTRLELGKTISFRLTGAGPLNAKTLLLASPHRYVVDLQGEWGVALPKVPRNLLLKEIRSGQRENATRLVLELKRKPESAQVVKIDAQTLEVRIR